MTNEQTAHSILLVDDTVENLRVLTGMLGKRGYDVRPVTSGADALEAIAHDVPDLILLDVSMPGMNGFEFCERLKAQPVLSEIPIIFLTALTDLSDKLKGFALGGSDYITKPFQFEEVVARVSQHLALQTARRRLAISLVRQQELERLRDDMVHMVVHDMRSPLSAMIMSLDMLGYQLKTEHRETLDYALHSARRLNGMMETLLDISRLEEGKMPIVRTPCDLSTVIAEAVRALSALEPERAIIIETTGPRMASCDVGLIRRVLENLISNGIKHTPRGGRLTIDVAEREGALRVSVRDQGAGVPEEARARIFEKFGASATRKDRSYHSVGLGLCFCRLAIEAHGGTIGVDCDSPPGSHFWFELPAA